MSRLSTLIVALHLTIISLAFSVPSEIWFAKPF